MAVSDRVGFAARFLSDPQLTSFLSQKHRELTSLGVLEGLLLTGLRAAGVKLLQAYVDRTRDVQTAALLCCFFVDYAPGGPLESVRVHGFCVALPVSAYCRCVAGQGGTVVRNWIDCYRELLNRWQSWHARARYDVARTKVREQLKKSLGLPVTSQWSTMVRRYFCFPCVASCRLVAMRLTAVAVGFLFACLSAGRLVFVTGQPVAAVVGVVAACWRW